MGDGIVMNIKKGDILRKKRFGMNDELLRVVEVRPEEGITRVKGKDGYDWDMWDGERNRWQHIPCGRA